MASRRFTLQVCVASALAAAVLCGPVTVTAGDRAAHDPGWTTWGNRPVRQSHTTTSLLTSATAGGLRLAGTRDLGGVGNAQPLYLRGISTAGSTRDGYIAAGERGRVVAYDAVNGTMLWKRELGALATGCFKMPSGVFGVTGTPVYEPAGGFVYVAATDKLWALDAHTGKVRPGWPVTLPVDDLHEHVWGALALGNGHVYLGTASYCDRRPYRGACSPSRRARAPSITRGSRSRHPTEPLAVAASGAGAAWRSPSTATSGSRRRTRTSPRPTTRTSATRRPSTSSRRTSA